MKYKRGRPLTLCFLVWAIRDGETVLWNGKPRNAAFLAHCQLNTLIRGVAADAFHQAIPAEEAKK